MKILALATTFALFLPTFARLSSSYFGCYTTSDGLTDEGTFTFQEVKYCMNKCNEAGYKYAGLQDSNCWCGDSKPPSSALVDDDECDTVCPGWPEDNCGGDNKWSVYEADGMLVEHDSITTSSTSTTTTTTIASTVSVETSTEKAATTKDTSSASSTGGVPSSTSTSSTQDSESKVTSTPASTSSESSSTKIATASTTPTPFTSNANRRYSFLW